MIVPGSAEQTVVRYDRGSGSGQVMVSSSASASSAAMSVGGPLTFVAQRSQSV